MTTEEAKLVLRSWGVPKGREYEAIMTLIPELRESEDEGIRKWIIDELKDSLHEIETMYSGDYDNRDEQDKERQAYLNKALAYLEKQKEQKPNIELIQKSWYMEGYNDRDFNKEPRWVIKTGEGGPRYEENPKYGQHIEEKPVDYEAELKKCKDNPLYFFDKYVTVKIKQKPAEWSEDFDKEVENVHKRYPEVSFAKLTRIAYHFSKWANSYKGMEWSEEDEQGFGNTLWAINQAHGIAKDVSAMGTCSSAENWVKKRIKSLRPVSKESLQSWKPSEDEERLINTSISFLKDFADKGYENAVECIDWLKSKLNGNTCK